MIFNFDCYYLIINIGIVCVTCIFVNVYSIYIYIYLCICICMQITVVVSDTNKCLTLHISKL